MLPPKVQAPLLERAATIRKHVRAAGLPVIYVVVRFRDGYPEVNSRNKHFSSLKGSGRSCEGTPGAEVHTKVAPQKGDVIVTKRRVGAFSSTDLETILRAKNVRTRVLLGISTSGVVLSTTRWAAKMDYQLVIVSDACADRDAKVHRVLTEKVFPWQATVTTGAVCLAEVGGVSPGVGRASTIARSVGEIVVDLGLGRTLKSRRCIGGWGSFPTDLSQGSSSDDVGSSIAAEAMMTLVELVQQAAKENVAPDVVMAALAGVGVMGGIGCGDPRPALEQRLGKEVVRFSDPFARCRSWEDLRLLGGAWQALKDATRRRYLVELRDWDHWPEIVSVLTAAPVNAIGFHITAKSPAHVVDLKWPLRVGVAPGPRAPALVTALQAWRMGTHWVEPLVEMVERPQEDDDACDLLVFTGGESALETVRQLRVPVTTDVAILTSVGPAELVAACEQIPPMLNLLQAHAGLLVDWESGDLRWLEALLRFLSHNLPWDVAVQEALRHLSCDPHRMTLVSTQLFLAEAKLDRFVQPLVDRLKEAGAEIGVELHPSPVLPGPGTPIMLPAPEVARIIGDHVHAFQYTAESEGATVLARAAAGLNKAAGRPDAKDARPSAGPSRSLQHRIDARDQVDALPPEVALVAGQDYEVTFRIAPPEAGWTGADEPFSGPPVTPKEGSRVLTVVFWEPTSVPEPQLKTILLPRRGPSSPCSFEFKVLPEQNVFAAQVMVLHNNRLVQAAALEAPVRRSKQSRARASEARTSFKVVAEPRPPACGFEERTKFDAAIVVGGGRDKKSRSTVVRGYRAQRVDLPGAKAALDGITEVFDSFGWEAYVTRPTDVSFATLLADLASHGSLLYDALTEDKLLAESLRRSKYLQVYAADAGSRLPLEFCYEHEVPEAGAEVCPHAVDALARDPKDPLLPECTKCPERGNRARVCPLAFWGLSRVIEWRAFDADAPNDLRTGFEISSEPRARDRLTPLQSVVHASSEKVAARHLRIFSQTARSVSKTVCEARNWTQWEKAVQDVKPSMLVLMPHVEQERQLPVMEIKSKVLKPPNVRPQYVTADPAGHPLVLLLGCGAATARVDFQSLPAQFRRGRAAVVIAAMAELLAEHSPLVAQAILNHLNTAREGSSVGEVLLHTKRQLLANKNPAGLLLLGFGDADWRI